MPRQPSRKRAMTDSEPGPGPSRKKITPLNQEKKDHLSWESFFMSLACLLGKRSKDPKTQVGACIVTASYRVVGMGYNGMPDGIHDSTVAWGSDEKHPLVCHAEMNAVVKKCVSDVKGCTLYVTLFPCKDCTKVIIQSGIKKVIYLRKRDKEYDESARTLERAGVVARKFDIDDQSSQPMWPIQIDLRNETGKP